MVKYVVSILKTSSVIPENKTPNRRGYGQKKKKTGQTTWN